MYKIAVMGDRDSIYGFASLGLEPFPLTDPAEAGKKVKDLAESGYAVNLHYEQALAARLNRRSTATVRLAFRPLY